MTNEQNQKRKRKNSLVTFIAGTIHLTYGSGGARVHRMVHKMDVFHPIVTTNIRIPPQIELYEGIYYI